MSSATVGTGIPHVPVWGSRRLVGRVVLYGRSGSFGKLACIRGGGKLTCVGGEPAIAPSARKHGVSDDTILHAFNSPIRAEDLDEGLVMLVGPDHAGNLFEVGVVTSDEGPVIVHAMPARPKYRR